MTTHTTMLSRHWQYTSFVKLYHTLPFFCVDRSYSDNNNRNQDNVYDDDLYCNNNMFKNISYNNNSNNLVVIFLMRVRKINITFRMRTVEININT